MSKDFNIVVAGLGTVGTGLIQLIQSRADELKSITGRAWRVRAIAVRDASKPRSSSIDLKGVKVTEDVLSLLDESLLDGNQASVVVELIGGSDGPAYDLVRTALSRGISVVTANKAMLAAHADQLAKLSQQGGASLRFEAAVAGAVPIIKVLKDSLVANRISSLEGILNSTCNFILSRMHATSDSFASALAVCQQQGYAEADPSMDINGSDSAHKLAILSSIAFARPIDFDSISVTGIENVTARDVAAAKSKGRVIKLVSKATIDADGRLSQTVAPTLLDSNHALARVDGIQTAIRVKGDFCGDIFLSGAGAGSKPTASAVAADLVDVAKVDVAKVDTAKVDVAKIDMAKG